MAPSPTSATPRATGARRPGPRILGFVGKWAIHPSQIEIANEIYSPTKDEVARARKMAEVYAKAEADGLGAVTFEA